jgi:hypothetical protein
MFIIKEEFTLVFISVTCIARQRNGKHLATEYTDAKIELRMLLLVARQQSARQSASEVTVTNWFSGTVP